jgi:DNA-binding transcriptional LysR family regulator
MDLEKIKTFCHLMENKTLVETAKITDLSISGVQRQITSMEEELGIKLFQKQNRLLKATPEGDRFYQHGLKILGDYEKALQELTMTSDELIGDFIINGTTTSVASWLTVDLSQFIQENEKVRFVIMGDDRPVRLLKNECDVFIRPKVVDEAEFEQRFVFNFTFNLYASKSYIQQNGLPETVEDLQKHRVLADGRPTSLVHGGINWHLSYLPHDYRNLIYISSGLGILMAIERGLGIGVISSYGSAKSNEELVKLLPDINPYSVDIYMIYPRNTLKRAHIDKMYQYLSRLYGSTPN